MNLQTHVNIAIKIVQKVKKIVMKHKMNVIRAAIITRMYSMVLHYLEKEKDKKEQLNQLNLSKYLMVKMNLLMNLQTHVNIVIKIVQKVRKIVMKHKMNVIRA